MIQLLSIVGVLAIATPALAQSAPQASASQAVARNSGEWPQATTVDGVTYTLNQPQFTGLSAGTVTMTSVLQVKGGDGAAHEGMVTMNASMATADVAGMVELNGFSISKVEGLPDPAGTSTALAGSLEGMAITLPLSTLTEDITVTATRNETKLSTAVPTILVTTQPTVLVSVNGQEVIRPVGKPGDGTDGWSRTINTPFILLHQEARQGGARVDLVRLGSDRWMKLSSPRPVASPTGMIAVFTATPADPPPAAVVAALGNPPATPDAARDDVERVDGSTATNPPAVMIATVPVVLVALQGEPKVVNIGNDIGLVTNTAQTVLVCNRSPRLWVLASGRWFSADTWTGPWTLVPPSNVPKAFGSVDTSRPRVAAAMASVPGTPAAKEAVASTGLVRTVVLQRSKAECGVTWDGDPAYATVEGTDMTYATNSSQPVIRFGGAYYCCDSAAWFTSTDDRGPWTLCDAVPQEIYTIPANCPVYPVTFVQVYGSDADTVTFGFTSGYVGTYTQDGAVVFGTGYDGGIGPQTWGTQATYDSDTGTFAPPAADTWGAWQPAVCPEVLASGWSGWGWYPGWSAAYGWGWGHWGWNGGWDRWWNNWHPYDGDRWNNAWNDRSRADQLRNGAMNRAVNDRGFDEHALARGGSWNAIQRGIDAKATNARMWNMANAKGDFNDPRAAMRSANGSAEFVGDGHRSAPQEGRRPMQRTPSGFHQANHSASHGGGRR